MIQSLSLDEKIGQILMFGMHGTRVTDRVKRLITEKKLGGLILFLRNIESVGQLSDLTGGLQELSPHPLFLSADQEGGAVLRLRHGATLLPSAMGLGTLEPARTEKMAEICGKEMQAVGLNVNLAPVLDINDPMNPGLGIRSFGEDPERVIRHGLAYLQGIQSTGVLATVKHFPGKGRARLDSHLDLPVLPLGRSQLDEWELKPFRAAIDAGVDLVMTSHCVYSEIDDLPATLSAKILTDLLRTELGFKGILITDDMEMGAISRYHPGPAASLKSFEAGADQILICADEELQDQVIHDFKLGFESGSLSQERLEASVSRICKVKQKLKPREGAIDGLVVEHSLTSARIINEIIEIARDPDHLIPIEEGDSLRVYWPMIERLTKVEEGRTGPEFLRSRLETRFHHVEWIEFDPRTGPASMEPGTRGATTLFFTANAHLFQSQARALREASAWESPLIQVVLRNPYDQDLIRTGTCILTYGFLENVIRALTSRLCGE